MTWPPAPKKYKNSIYWEPRWSPDQRGPLYLWHTDDKGAAWFEVTAPHWVRSRLYAKTMSPLEFLVETGCEYHKAECVSKTYDNDSFAEL